MQVVYCSTPANYFHVLRRQLNRDFRKPLVIMTPKSLLRHKMCVSRLDEFTNNTSFHRVLDEADKSIKNNQVKRVVMCSGKVYYDLLEERDKQGLKDIKLVRLEQLYPFPRKSVAKILSATKDAELVWCQEEPRNMGSWTFVRDYLEDAMAAAGMKASRPIYVGRREAASPATGSAGRHREEQAALVESALDRGKQTVAAE